ncbi:MAG: precorrin-3B C(17)-methyltransferase, partial [Pseudomonadota bacterium]
LAGRAARLAGGPAHLAPLTAPGADGAPPRAAPAPAPAPGQMTLAVEGAPPARFFETRLALGVGCARGCPPEALAELAAAALAEAGADPAALAAIGSLDLKADEAAVGALARALGRELRLFTAEELERERDRLASPSETVFAEVGCHGVAEGAALALAGPRARLILPKRKNAVATAALAAAPAPILALSGRARGRLAVVGLGPGAADWRTPEASRLIAEAEELVGYGLYLDLLGPAARGKARRAFPLGAERERCAYALERAGEGRSVALISSGDAGIYAMAALVLELLDPDTADGASDAARRAELTIAPGITAMQAAAARAGAPLGHDFCAISLSDLLTPRATILARVRAAAAGDFVIAFYNPVSQRRRTLLAEAREILIAARGGAAPVLLAADLGRPAERLRARSLETLDVDEVDMLTTVLVGARGSRFFATGDHAAGAEGRRLYTPRGYAAKPGGAGGAGDGRTGSEDGA